MIVCHPQTRGPATCLFLESQGSECPSLVNLSLYISSLERDLLDQSTRMEFCVGGTRYLLLQMCGTLVALGELPYS